MWLFKKKNNNENNNIDDKNIIPCTANMNTAECSLVSQIHTLQDRKDELQKELDDLNSYKTNVPINGCILNDFKNCLRWVDNIFYPIDQYHNHVNDIKNVDLYQIIYNLNSGELFELSDKLKQCAELSKKPQEIKEEISDIDKQIKELKNKLGIQ